MENKMEKNIENEMETGILEYPTLETTECKPGA